MSGNVPGNAGGKGYGLCLQQTRLWAGNGQRATGYGLRPEQEDRVAIEDSFSVNSAVSAF
jgi:hypothetical protein